jgi:hypothetical protein
MVGQPWLVSFADEAAVDAGGPARELITDAAVSIFEPTSRLVISVPDEGHGFLPWNAAPQILWGIGVLIGIIIRTGLPQDLPFAPFVWKYLAGETLTERDILEVDSELDAYLKSVRERTIEASWVIKQWDGVLAVIPGHYERSVIDSEIDAFAVAAVQSRIRSLAPALKQIRKGFRDNVGFKKLVYVSGSILSRAAQGMPTISLAHLKAITAYIDWTMPADAVYLDRFWSAVARFSEEERKLLLKFITTLTRLPNAIVCPKFRIVIVPLVVTNPDQCLPTAATCFAKLQLPRYSDTDIAYRKIQLAVQYCLTMENQ